MCVHHEYMETTSEIINYTDQLLKQTIKITLHSISIFLQQSQLFNFSNVGHKILFSAQKLIQIKIWEQHKTKAGIISIKSIKCNTIGDSQVHVPVTGSVASQVERFVHSLRRSKEILSSERKCHKPKPVTYHTKQKLMAS